MRRFGGVVSSEVDAAGLVRDAGRLAGLSSSRKVDGLTREVRRFGASSSCDEAAGFVRDMRRDDVSSEALTRGAGLPKSAGRLMRGTGRFFGVSSLAAERVSGASSDVIARGVRRLPTFFSGDEEVLRRGVRRGSGASSEESNDRERGERRFSPGSSSLDGFARGLWRFASSSYDVTSTPRRAVRRFSTVVSAVGDSVIRRARGFS